MTTHGGGGEPTGDGAATSDAVSSAAASAVEQPFVLEARDVTVGYGPVPVVSELHLNVRAGEIVALLGANGAGKTTTLLALAGELPLDAGEVRIHGRSESRSLSHRAREGLAFITEERSIFMGLTCEQNLRLGRGEVERALELVPELRPLLRRRAGLLSGGEQQMLTVARALAARPNLLLADELSLGLAPLIVDRLLHLLRSAADEGLAVLLVEQQVQRALETCDRGYVLRQGSVVLEGSASELLRRLPEVEAQYLSTASDDAHPS